MVLPRISKSKEIEERVSTGLLIFERISCQKKNDDLWQEILGLANSYRNRYSSPSEALEKLQPARKLYRSVGMEPTRLRPSSEALFRRAVKGKTLYQVNSVVDVCNLCSMSFFLPIGLYDTDKIRGAVNIRVGTNGEGYQGIGKGIINVSDRLCLADDEGPFGNPSSDSLRTSVSLQSKRLLLVIFAPKEFDTTEMEQNLSFATCKMVGYHPTAVCVKKEIM